MQHLTKLPNGKHAVVEMAKLRDYCLSVVHLRGKHKARVFEEVLGITSDHADDLKTSLLVAAHEQEAVASDHDEYGQRYVVDFTMKGPKGEAVVRSTWIVKTNEHFPRLTSCYVK